MLFSVSSNIVDNLDWLKQKCSFCNNLIYNNHILCSPILKLIFVSDKYYD